MLANLTNCANSYPERVVAKLCDDHLSSDSELPVVIVPHKSLDNVEDTCLSRCSKLGFDHGGVFEESQMLSPRPIGVDFRGFIGKNWGKQRKTVRRMNLE